MFLQRTKPARQTDSQTGGLTTRSGWSQGTKPPTPSKQHPNQQQQQQQPKLKTINTADLVPSPRQNHNRLPPEKLNFQFSNYTPGQSENPPGAQQNTSDLPRDAVERPTNPHDLRTVDPNRDPATETRPSNPQPTFDTHYEYKPSTSAPKMPPPASTPLSSSDNPTPRAAESSVLTTVTTRFSVAHLTHVLTHLTHVLTHLMHVLTYLLWVCRSLLEDRVLVTVCY